MNWLTSWQCWIFLFMNVEYLSICLVPWFQLNFVVFLLDLVHILLDLYLSNSFFFLNANINVTVVFYIKFHLFIAARKVIGFCILIWYPAIWPNSVIFSNILCKNHRIFNIYEHIICKEGQFWLLFLSSQYGYLLFLGLYSFDLFYWFIIFIALSRISSAMLNGNDESRHLCLVIDHKRRHFVFHH